MDLGYQRPPPPPPQLPPPPPPPPRQSSATQRWTSHWDPFAAPWPTCGRLYPRHQSAGQWPQPPWPGRLLRDSQLPGSADQEQNRRALLSRRTCCQPLENNLLAGPNRLNKMAMDIKPLRMCVDVMYLHKAKQNKANQSKQSKQSKQSEQSKQVKASKA